MSAHEHHGGPHSPDPEFIETFERELERTMRRTLRLSTSQLLQPRHLARNIAGVAALILVSIFLGAFGTYTAVQMDDRLDRELALERAKMELELSALRVQFIEEAYNEVRRRVESGAASDRELIHYEKGLRLAQLHLRGAELNLQETTLSGRPTTDDLGAPLVEGKDFVTQRLQLELEARMAEINALQRQLQRQKQLAEAGFISSDEMMATETRMKALELNVQQIEQRIQLRKDVLDGKLPAAEAELRNQREKAKSQLKEMQMQFDAIAARTSRIQQLVERGLAAESEMREAEFQQRELELQMRLAHKELEIIEQRIDLEEQSRNNTTDNGG